MEYAKGLIQLGFMPNRDFVCRDDGNGSFIETWLSNEARPTDSEISAAAEQYDANAYARSRAAEYPAIGDQLDALFHAGVFPADMAAVIQAVKDKYPKGGA